MTGISFTGSDFLPSECAALRGESSAERQVVRVWGQGRTVKCPFLVLSYGGHAEYEMASGFAGFVCFTAAKVFLFLTPHLPYIRNTNQLGSMGGESLSKGKLEMKGLELSRLVGGLDWKPQGLSDSWSRLLPPRESPVAFPVSPLSLLFPNSAAETSSTQTWNVLTIFCIEFCPF